MRPIPATRLGDAHGLLRAIETRGRLRTDEFVTEFNLDDLFPPDLENALGRMRHFISFCRLAISPYILLFCSAARCSGL